MSKPGIFTQLIDSFIVSCKGGVRVRVWQEAGAAHASVLGTVRGFRQEKLMAMVLELKPSGSGVVDFYNLGTRNWKIRISGSLTDDNLEQRLRNMVVND